MSQFIEMTGDPRTNPKGWPVKTLPELATYSIGLTYKPENISEDGTIVLRSGNIQNSKIDLGYIVRVNCPIKESIYVQKNDILMCSRNGSAALVGKVAMIKDIPEPMTYGAFMTVIRSEYSDYLYLYFQSNDFREQVSTGKSSTMNQITQNMLDKISLPLPDDETRKILSIILHQADKSGFDGLKSQFIEMFKDKKTNGKITDLVDTDIKSVKKSFNKDDLIEYIDISSVNAKSRTLNETTQHIVSSAPSRAQQCVQNGDILVSTVRPINRNVAVVDRDLTNLVASTGFCVLRPKDGYREYLLSIVTSDRYTEKMCDIASGGLYPAVNNSDVLSYDIFIPDKDFLNRVTQIYRQADKSGFELRKSIETMDAVIKSLINS